MIHRSYGAHYDCARVTLKPRTKTKYRHPTHCTSTSNSTGPGDRPGGPTTGPSHTVLRVDIILYSTYSHVSTTESAGRGLRAIRDSKLSTCDRYRPYGGRQVIFINTASARTVHAPVGPIQHAPRAMTRKRTRKVQFLDLASADPASCTTTLVASPHKQAQAKRRKLMEPGPWMRFHPFIATLEQWASGVSALCGDLWLEAAIRDSHQTRPPHKCPDAGGLRPHQQRNEGSNPSWVLRNGPVEQHTTRIQ